MSRSANASLLLGTYTAPDGVGEGLVLLELDTEAGRLRRVDALGGISNPSFVAIAPGGTQAYATAEVGGEEDEDPGSLVSVALGGGALTLSGRVETGSAGPCHVAVSPEGRHAVVSNYTGGAVSLIALDGEGRASALQDLAQHSGSSVDSDRQSRPHAHSATFDPGGDRILVCDLGLDRLLAYRLLPESDRIQAVPELDLAAPAGTGPRHLAFDPAGRHVYVAGELNSTLLACDYDPSTGRLRELQVASTLGDAAPPRRNYPADVHVHPSGRFVYVSNRGLDAIAVFAIDERDGRVELRHNQSCGGRWPRNFAIDPTGRLLLSANQESDNVVPFWIDQTDGQLILAGEPLAVGSPACLTFVRA